MPIYTLKTTQLEFQNSAFWKGKTGLEPVWRKTSLKYFVYILAELLGGGGEVFFILFYLIFLFLNVSINNEQGFEFTLRHFKVK